MAGLVVLWPSKRTSPQALNGHWENIRSLHGGFVSVRLSPILRLQCAVSCSMCQETLGDWGVGSVQVIRVLASGEKREKWEKDFVSHMLTFSLKLDNYPHVRACTLDRNTVVCCCADCLCVCIPSGYHCLDLGQLLNIPVTWCSHLWNRNDDNPTAGLYQGLCGIILKVLCRPWLQWHTRNLALLSCLIPTPTTFLVFWHCFWCEHTWDGWKLPQGSSTSTRTSVLYELVCSTPLVL
jgi:hypothetical protein